MLASIVLVTTLVLLIVVWSSTSKSITDNLTSRLELAESVINRELINRQQILLKHSHILVEDYTFKNALKAGNNQDIQQVISLYRDMIDAEFISIRNSAGTEIESVGRLYEQLGQEQRLLHMAIAEKDGEATNLLMIDDRLVWVLWLPVNKRLGGLSDIVVIGFEVDQAYLEMLKPLVMLDISVLIQTDKLSLISSLPAEKKRIAYLEASLIDKSKNSLIYLNPWLNSNSLFSHKFTQPSVGDTNNVIYISADGSKLKSHFLQLQLTIGAVALLALIFAIIAGRLLSKQITRPLEYIADYAMDISKGDYNGSFELDTSSVELEQLLHAFKSMEQGVKNRESEIVFQAQHDALTNLFNRNYISEYLDTLFNNKKPFQAIGINIKGFRAINDVFGYQYGDLCIKELAKRIEARGGTSARVSGGEILWIPRTFMRAPEIEKFKASLDTNIHINNVSVPIKTSIGILNCPSDTKSAEDLFRRMNIVLDNAPLSANLIVEFSNKFEEQYLRRLSIIENLRVALASNSRDLSLHYQPKINLKSGDVKHAEALIRWRDKELGNVEPDEFILVAEQAGLINQVTSWVLDQVINDLQILKEHEVDICIAINISAQDLLNEDFADYTRNLLNKHNFCNSDISFELTESVIVQEPERSIEQMQSLRDAGFSLAIDDFGTGYSSLSYITQLPVDTIKIDKCFVMPLAKSTGEQAICKAVLKLAKSFNMQVVAEGVEDSESMALLTKWGCNFAQGYHIARPIPLQELIPYLQTKATC